MKTFEGLARLQRHFANHPLTCDAPLQAWLRFAQWQLRSRLQGEVLLPWVGGQRLAVRRGMKGATGNIYAGLHEFFDMMVPLHFLREGDLFLDVGANVGTYTVLASGVCGAETLAFEPDPGTLRYLRRNIEINRLDGRVQVFECALGEASGDVAFTVGLDAENKLATAGHAGTQTVHMARLDEIASHAHPAMMKADVEGAEWGVLCGAERMLADPSLKVIEMETVVPESAAMLARHGFRAACYDPFHRTLSEASSACKASNALFVRDWAFVADRLRTAAPVEIFGRPI